MSDGKRYEFVCPECGNSITVNAAMKDTLTSAGCVLCGTDVSESAFTSI